MKRQTLPYNFVTFILLFTLLFRSHNQVVAYDGWVEGKIKSMSVEEKIGQMLMVHLKGKTLDYPMAKDLNRGFYGSIILFEDNINSSSQLRYLVDQLQNHSKMRTGIPMIIAIDQEGGLVNRIGKLLDPSRSKYTTRTLGRAFDFNSRGTLAALRRFYSGLSLQMKHSGINMNLAPVLDLTDDPTSYIYSRSYSGNPQTVVSLANELTESMQKNAVMVAGKHFPGLGTSQMDSHIGLPVIYKSKQELLKIDIRPYNALKTKLDTIMLAHALIPSIDPVLPSSLSVLTTNLIRKKLGYDGVIMTDDLKMGAIGKNFTLNQSVDFILKADIDLILVASQTDLHHQIFDLILDSVKSKKVDPSRIDRSVRRILSLKRKYLFEIPKETIFYSSDEWPKKL